MTEQDPMTRLYTAEEVMAVIKAVIKVERDRAAKIMRYQVSIMASNVEKI